MRLARSGARKRGDVGWGMALIRIAAAMSMMCATLLLSCLAEFSRGSPRPSQPRATQSAGLPDFTRQRAGFPL